MTMLLQPGHVGIDYAGARPKPGATRKAGGGFVIRYSAGVGNTQPATAFKLCGVDEIAAAVAAGMDFVANSEWYETRITEGAEAGAADGAADLAFWRSRGLAKGATVYVSWDAAPVQSVWPHVDAYLKAYGRALQGHYSVSCYAGTPYLKHALAAGIIAHGWRPNAYSWSNDGLPYQPHLTGELLDRARAATPASIWQTGNYWFGTGADEDVILRTPVGSHLEALNPTAEDDVMTDEQMQKLAAMTAAAVVAQPIQAHDGTKTTLGMGVAQAERHAQAADRALNAKNGLLARAALLQQAVDGIKVGPVDVGQLAAAVVTRIANLLGSAK